MHCIWDERKNRSNRKKHGVSFETAIEVFEDPHAVSLIERVVDGEERWVTLGLVGGVVVLLVAHTYSDEGGDEVIRVISARKATASERKVYEEEL